MSLTTLIDDRQSAVSLFMAERFPNTRALQKVWRDDLAAQGVPTMRPASAPAAHPWGVIGSAIDYRIRYYFGLTPTADLIVGGHDILPGGGHETARWRPRDVPAGGQQTCPSA